MALPLVRGGVASCLPLRTCLNLIFFLSFRGSGSAHHVPAGRQEDVSTPLRSAWHDRKRILNSLSVGLPACLLGEMFTSPSSGLPKKRFRPKSYQIRTKVVPSSFHFRAYRNEQNTNMERIWKERILTFPASLWNGFYVGWRVRILILLIFAPGALPDAMCRGAYRQKPI